MLTRTVKLEEINSAGWLLESDNSDSGWHETSGDAYRAIAAVGARIAAAAGEPVETRVDWRSRFPRRFGRAHVVSRPDVALVELVEDVRTRQSLADGCEPGCACRGALPEAASLEALERRVRL